MCWLIKEKIGRNAREEKEIHCYYQELIAVIMKITLILPQP
jgi:hypothetical protein